MSLIAAIPVLQMKYSQIDRVLKELSKTGKVLIVLHNQHMRPERMDKFEYKITREWIESGSV